MFDEFYEKIALLSLVTFVLLSVAIYLSVPPIVLNMAVSLIIYLFGAYSKARDQALSKDQNRLQEENNELTKTLVDIQSRIPEFELDIIPIEDMWDFNKLRNVSPYHKYQKEIEQLLQTYENRKTEAKEKIKKLNNALDSLNAAVGKPTIKDYEEYLRQLEDTVAEFSWEYEPPKISVVRVRNVGVKKATNVQLEVGSNGKVYTMDTPLDIDFPVLPKLPPLPTFKSLIAPLLAPNPYLPQSILGEKDSHVRVENMNHRVEVIRYSDNGIEIRKKEILKNETEVIFVVHPFNVGLCLTVEVQCEELLKPVTLTAQGT